jgi:hypothetical protein
VRVGGDQSRCFAVEWLFISEESGHQVFLRWSSHWVLPLGLKFVECKTSTAWGAALDPYRGAPGMSFVLYLFMLDEVGTPGMCGEEGIFVEQI